MKSEMLQKEWNDHNNPWENQIKQSPGFLEYALH